MLLKLRRRTPSPWRLRGRGNGMGAGLWERVAAPMRVRWAKAAVLQVGDGGGRSNFARAGGFRTVGGAASVLAGEHRAEAAAGVDAAPGPAGRPALRGDGSCGYRRFGPWRRLSLSSPARPGTASRVWRRVPSRLRAHPSPSREGICSASLVEAELFRTKGRFRGRILTPSPGLSSLHLGGPAAVFSFGMQPLPPPHPPVPSLGGASQCPKLAFQLSLSVLFLQHLPGWRLSFCKAFRPVTHFSNQHLPPHSSSKGD